MIKYSDIKIKSLLPFCVYSQSEDLDCPKCGEDYDIAFDLTDEEMESEDFVPMMNYCYQLEDEFSVPDNIKEILNEAGAITLIRKTSNDRHYLALSGGGMDLSWDICRAYVLLGYLPPLKFCSLPRFAGMNLNRIRNKKVIQACKRTGKIVEADGKRIKKRVLS